jgi:RNA polymerase sigma-70 factor (ECF subfamily)
MRLLDEADDTSLVAGTLAGSPDAAAALFRRYVDGIFAFAFVRIRRDRAAAEDVTQEVFSDAWRNLSLFRTGESFPGWLVGIAKRKLARHFRNEAMRPECGPGSLLDVLDEKAAGPEDSLDAEETAMEVSRALALVSPGARVVLLMKYRDQLSIKQIGERLGGTPEAVNSRLQRAREELRKALGTGGTD